MNSSPEQQRSNALARANEIRRKRAAVRRVLRETRNRGESLALLADVLEEKREEIQSAEIGWMIESCYRVGHTRARTIMRTLELGPSTKVSSLSPKRLAVVVFYLRTFKTSPPL